MNELLSLRGRFNRSRYVITTAAITIVTYAVAFVVGILMGLTGTGEQAASAVGAILGLCGQIVVAFVCVKRLHDLNRPSWHFWLLLVPLYNIYLGLVMLFVKGTDGTNEYGPNTVAA